MLALRLLLLGCGATVAVGQQARAGEAAASLRAAEEERVQIGPGDNYDDDKVPAAATEGAAVVAAVQPEAGHELLPRRAEDEAVPEARHQPAAEVREGVAAETVRRVAAGTPISPRRRPPDRHPSPPPRAAARAAHAGRGKAPQAVPQAREGAEQAREGRGLLLDEEDDEAAAQAREAEAAGHHGGGVRPSRAAEPAAAAVAAAAVASAASSVLLDGRFQSVGKSVLLLRRM